MIVEVWADYVCPWCYLALDLADHLASTHGAEVRWRPFELHPEVPAEGRDAPRGRLSSDARGELKNALSEANLPAKRRERISNSAKALALSAWAEPLAEWTDLHLRLFNAYWVDGVDIGDVETLGDIAASVGIDRGDAIEAVRTGLGRVAVSNARERALDLGIGGTPGWHFGKGVVLVGAHPRAVFDRVIARLEP